MWLRLRQGMTVSRREYMQLMRNMVLPWLLWIVNESHVNVSEFLLKSITSVCLSIERLSNDV